jgi:hypothetical protein
VGIKSQLKTSTIHFAVPSPEGIVDSGCVDNGC